MASCAALAEVGLVGLGGALLAMWSCGGVFGVVLAFDVTHASHKGEVVDAITTAVN